MKENLSKLTELEDSNNVSVIVGYKSGIKEFRKPEIKLQKFSPRELLDIPEVIKTFNTGYEYIRSICFYIGVGIWISALIGDMKCFSIDGKYMKTIRTNSEGIPNDIFITRGGNLVYCASGVNTFNKIKDGKIKR